MKLPLGRCTDASPVRAGSIAFGLVVGAVVVALGAWPAPVRAVIAVGLIALASVARRFLAGRRAPPFGWLVVDDDGVRRTGGGQESSVVEWRDAFGVTVLSTPDRKAFLLALTTRQATRYLSARVRGADDAASAPTMFDLAITATGTDLRSSVGDTLTAADAEALLRAIARRAPGAFERLYLTNAGGEPVVIEHGHLQANGRRIDLSTPLEWRASIFQEHGPHVASVCQATWVRQGDAEFVLVASLPGEGIWLEDRDGLARAVADRASFAPSLLRDARLLQAAAGEPPPRELRCAIDRLFMLPLRCALDRAPRQKRGLSRRSLRDTDVGGGRQT